MFGSQRRDNIIYAATEFVYERNENKKKKNLLRRDVLPSWDCARGDIILLQCLSKTINIILVRFINLQLLLLLLISHLLQLRTCPFLYTAWILYILCHPMIPRFLSPVCEKPVLSMTHLQVWVSENFIRQATLNLYFYWRGTDSKEKKKERSQSRKSFRSIPFV